MYAIYIYIYTCTCRLCVSVYSYKWILMRMFLCRNRLKGRQGFTCAARQATPAKPNCCWSHQLAPYAKFLSCSWSFTTYLLGLQDLFLNPVFYIFLPSGSFTSRNWPIFDDQNHTKMIHGSHGDFHRGPFIPRYLALGHQWSPVPAFGSRMGAGLGRALCGAESW